MNETTILVIEDEPKLAQLIIDYLEAAGFSVVWFPTGSEAASYMSSHTPSIILLDIMLPDKNGFDICQKIRSNSDIPIIIITARGQEEDRLKGFELGADDYICKPFSYKELVSRVKAILKRVGTNFENNIRTKPILEIKADAYEAFLDGVLINLTPQEFRILAALSDHPGRVFTRSELILKAYPDTSASNDRAVDSQIKNLRKKIKDVNTKADMLKSIYGVGYKLENYSPAK